MLEKAKRCYWSTWLIASDMQHNIILFGENKREAIEDYLLNLFVPIMHQPRSNEVHESLRKGIIKLSHGYIIKYNNLQTV